MKTKTLERIYRESLQLVDNKNVFERDILFLMEEVFNINKNDIYVHGEKEYNIEVFTEKLERLTKGEPIEYIVNKAYFYKRNYYVNSNVLIPRNETEELIEKTIFYLKKYDIVAPNIVEVGSGSGCISISLFKELSDCRVDSFDISPAALEVAKLNNKKLGAQVHFMEGNCLEEAIRNKKKYDVIISNPPYIDRDTYVQSSVVDYEPEIALFAGNHGLAIYERIFKEIPLCAKEKNFIAFEISPDLVSRLEILAGKYLPGYRYSFEKDMNGVIRFMFLMNE